MGRSNFEAEIHPGDGQKFCEKMYIPFHIYERQLNQVQPQFFDDFILFHHYLLTSSTIFPKIYIYIHLTRDMWHLTHDIWHVTFDMWHLTHGGRWTISQNSSPPALMVLKRQCIEDISTNDDQLNEWINDGGVCRTAPAPPCLLNMVQFRENKRTKRLALFAGGLAYSVGGLAYSVGQRIKSLRQRIKPVRHWIKPVHFVLIFCLIFFFSNVWFLSAEN